MLFWWECLSFHLFIHNFNSTYSPALTYPNLFLFTTASFHLLIYSFNITFSATLNIFLFTTACFNPLWYAHINILIVGVTCCSTCSGCFINKTALCWRRLIYTFLFLFLLFFLYLVFELPMHSASSIGIFLLYLPKAIFNPYIIHPDNWTVIAWNERIFDHALLHHHLEPQCHIVLIKSHSIFSNSNLLFEILMHGLLISNELICFRWRSYTFVLI